MSAITSPDPRAVHDRDVVIDVPARARSLRLLRLAVADAAADLDMDLDAIESARIAVDELATLLLSAAQWTRLVLRIDSADRRLRVRGETSDARGEVTEVQADRVVRELLAVCVDDYGVQGGSSFWFTIGVPSADADPSSER